MRLTIIIFRLLFIILIQAGFFYAGYLKAQIDIQYVISDIIETMKIQTEIITKLKDITK